jgi:hypothetical protein
MNGKSTKKIKHDKAPQVYPSTFDPLLFGALTLGGLQWRPNFSYQ